MRVLRISMLFLIISHLSIRLPAQDRESPTSGIDALSAYLGDWSTEVVSRPAEWTLRESRSKTVCRYERILNGSCLQRIESTYSDSAPDQITKSLWFVTHDAQSDVYHTWWFQSSGLNGHTVGTWDSLTQSLAQSDVNPPQGATSRFSERFPDESTIAGSLVIVSKSNQNLKLMDMEWTRRQSSDDATRERLRQWHKLGSPVRPRPMEVSRLAALDRDYDIEVTIRHDANGPDEGPRKGTMTGKWILDGRSVLVETVVDEIQTCSVVTYDNVREVYFSVTVSSTGDVVESTGQWDASTRTMHWTGVDASRGLTTATTTQLRTNVEIQHVANFPNGNVHCDMKITSGPYK